MPLLYNHKFLRGRWSVSGTAMMLSMVPITFTMSFAGEPAVFAPGPVSSEEHELSPSFSPDGKYLFFTSGGPGDIYRVDAAVFRCLGPKRAEPNTVKDKKED
jgi:hypothetical protein